MGTDIRSGRLIKYDETLQEYSVPDGITRISDLAFSGAESLTHVTIPDSVVSIGNYAFSGCYSLYGVRFPERVDHIGTGLFQNCWKLREVTFPEGLIILGGEMLESCHALRAVHLPDSLRHIERSSFNTCRSLRYIYISPEKMEILPTPVRNMATLTYMSTHTGSEPCEIVDGYAAKKQRLLIDLALNRHETNAVRYMLERGIADPDTMRTYLSKSAATNRVEITALLLEYSRGAGSDTVLDGDPFV